MKNILIINSNREQNYYIKFLIEGCVDSKIIVRESLNETIKDHSDLITQASVVIVDFDIKNFKAYLAFIANQQKIIQTLVTYNNANEYDVFDVIASGPNIQKYNIESESTSHFEKSLTTLLKFDYRLNKIEKYCKVKIDYFFKSQSLTCDVYIQISEEKYLKIINRHEKYETTEIQKYIDKGVKYLFIKDNDFKLFVNGMIQSIQTQKHNQLPIKQENTNTIPLACIETVHELVSKIGLTTQALILTNESINQTLSLIKKSPLLKLLKSTLGSGSYISELSLLTNYISCAICKESEWAAPDNYLRLSLSSFFQNISLDNDDQAKVDKISTPYFEQLPSKVKKVIIDHPNKSCELIDSIAGLPLGVDKIIKNHHEKYDGTGFPRGIDHSKHEALTAIFIVSLELSNILFVQGFNRDIILETIEKMEMSYTKSQYPKVIIALKKSFAVPLNDLLDSQY